jgi:hypothetical protein
MGISVFRGPEVERVGGTETVICVLTALEVASRSRKADDRVAPREMEQKPERYKMLRPGFEPGISDSKGRYA